MSDAEQPSQQAAAVETAKRKRGRPRGSRDTYKRTRRPRSAPVEQRVAPDHPEHHEILDHSSASESEDERPQKKQKKEDKDKEKPQQEDDYSSEGSGSESEEEEEGWMPDIEWPATISIIADKFSGKSTLLRSLMRPEEWDNVWIVTMTKHTGNLDCISPGGEKFILEDLTEEFLESLLEHQKKTNARTAIVFDDFVGTTFDPCHSAKMKQIATSGRNHNLSLVFSCQDLKFIPTEIRRNSEYKFVGNNTNEVIEKFAKQYSHASMPKERTIAKLNKIARDQNYEFLFTDKRTQKSCVFKPPNRGKNGKQERQKAFFDANAKDAGQDGSELH